MMISESILERLKRHFGPINSFFSRGNFPLFNFFNNFSKYLIEDLFLGQEPKERKTKDPAYAFYKPISIFSEKWHVLRSHCKENEQKCGYVLSAILKNLVDQDFLDFSSSLEKIWHDFNSEFLKSYKNILLPESNYYDKNFPLDISFLYDTDLENEELSLDKIIEKLPEIFSNQPIIAREILQLFQKAKNIAKGLSIKNIPKIKDKSIRNQKIIEILQQCKGIELNQQNLEFLKDLSVNLNEFKKQLSNLIIPLYYFMISQLKTKEEQEGFYKIFKISEISEKSLQKFLALNFEATGNIQSYIRKLNFVKKILIELLFNIKYVFSEIIRKQFFGKNLFITIEKGLKTIDALNSIYTGLGWDLSNGILQNISVEKILEYSEIIEQIPEIKNIAEQLGRFEGTWATKEIWQLSPFITQEIYDIHQSNDLSRALAVELVKLKHPVLKNLFMANWLDHKLMTYALRGKYLTSTKESKKERRGPVIICIDTSGSMEGYPEQVSKALSLAVLKITREQKRDVHIVLFSGPSQYKEMTFDQKVFERPSEFENDKISYEKTLNNWNNQKREYYSKVIELLSYSFHGGTDFRTPLEQAKKMLSQSAFKLADVLFVSDGISFIDNVLREISDEIKKQQARVFGVVIGSEYSIMKEFSDQIYVLNPNELPYSANLDIKIGKILKKISPI